MGKSEKKDNILLNGGKYVVVNLVCIQCEKKEAFSCPENWQSYDIKEYLKFRNNNISHELDLRRQTLPLGDLNITFPPFLEGTQSKLR